MAEPEFRLTHRLPTWSGHPLAIGIVAALFAWSVVSFVGYLNELTDAVNVDAIVLRFFVICLLGWLLAAVLIVRRRQRRKNQDEPTGSDRSAA